MKALKELRRSLGDDATYAVSKNTLTTIAAREAGVEGIEEQLVGPTAIAFIDGDPVVVAKGLRDFARHNPLLVIKGGVLDGKSLTADEVQASWPTWSRARCCSPRSPVAMQGVLQQAISLVRCSAVPGRPRGGRPGEGSRRRTRRSSPVLVHRWPSRPRSHQRRDWRPTGGRLPSSSVRRPAAEPHPPRRQPSSTRCGRRHHRSAALRKTTEEGTPSWRSSALTSSWTPSRS